MDREALVCGEWPLRLRGGEGGYYHYINARRGEVGRNAHCIRWLLEECNEPIDSAVEPFGGVGVFATVIQKVCAPTYHTIGDLDDDCLTQLRQAFGGNRTIEVIRADARAFMGSRYADLYLMDFPSPYTLMRFEDWRVEWERLAALKPKLVVWMDSASFGMQWHAERYAKLVSRSVTENKSYAEAVSDFMFQHTGYSLRAATVSRGCFYFAASPGPVDVFNLQKFTTEGLGLEWR